MTYLSRDSCRSLSKNNFEEARVVNDERANEAPLRGFATQIYERHEGLAVPLVHLEPRDRRAALLPQRV